MIFRFKNHILNDVRFRVPGSSPGMFFICEICDAYIFRHYIPNDNDNEVKYCYFNKGISDESEFNLTCEEQIIKNIIE